MQPPLVTNLPAILNVLKQDYGQSAQADAFLSEPTKTIGKEMEALFSNFETFTALACRWSAAVTQELDYSRGVASTSAPPLDENGHEKIENRSPERTAGELPDPSTVLEPAVPPPLPPLLAAQPPLPPVDGAGDGPPSNDNLPQMQVDAVSGEPKRKAPFDQEAWDQQLAMARAVKGQGKGEGNPEKKGKTTEE